MSRVLKRGNFDANNVQREDDVNTRGKRGHQQAKKRGLRGT